MSENDTIQNGAGVQQFYPGKYESPIEETLAWKLSKYLAPGVMLAPQVRQHTRVGLLRPDLLLYLGARRVVIECDGEEFHQDTYWDSARDAALLEGGHAELVIHCPGRSIVFGLEQCVYLISLLAPWAFIGSATASLRRQVKNVVPSDEALPHLKAEDIVQKGLCMFQVMIPHHRLRDEEDYPLSVAQMAEITWFGVPDQVDFVYEMREILKTESFASPAGLVAAWRERYLPGW